jgi:AraC-like DNA-binding protein
LLKENNKYFYLSIISIPFESEYCTNRAIIEIFQNIREIYDFRRPCEALSLPTDHIFTVKFYPGGLEAVLGLNQAAMNKQVINLHEILPPLLLDTMKQAVGFEERLIIIENFLLAEKMKRSKKDHFLQLVNDAIGEYQATGMQLNTSQVAERLFLTSKTINRYFHKAVGLSPKAYFSILRTRSALTAYMRAKESFDPWTYGYYDFSHFSKDVVKLTGQRISDQL